MIEVEINKRLEELTEIAKRIEKKNSNKGFEDSSLGKYAGFDMLKDLQQIDKLIGQLDAVSASLLVAVSAWMVVLKGHDMYKRTKDVVIKGREALGSKKTAEKNAPAGGLPGGSGQGAKLPDLDGIANKYNQSFGKALGVFKGNLDGALKAYKTSLTKLAQNGKKGNAGLVKCQCVCSKGKVGQMGEQVGGKQRRPPGNVNRRQAENLLQKRSPGAGANPTMAKGANGFVNYSTQAVKAGKSVGALTGAQRMLNTVMSANPMGMMIRLGMLLYENWDSIKAMLDSVWAKFEEAFPGIAGAVKTGIDGVIGFCSALPASIAESLSGVYEAFTGAFQSAFAWLGEKFGWLKGAYNSLFGKGGDGGGAGDVKRNARGGIITSPILTTFAEEGPEAAIPLDGTARSISLWYTAGHKLGMFGGTPPALAASLPGLGGGDQDIQISAPIHITINGNADHTTVQQVQQAAQAALMDLKRQIKQLQWQERRVSFG